MCIRDRYTRNLGQQGRLQQYARSSVLFSSWHFVFCMYVLHVWCCRVVPSPACSALQCSVPGINFYYFEVVRIRWQHETWHRHEYGNSCYKSSGIHVRTYPSNCPGCRREKLAAALPWLSCYDVVAVAHLHRAAKFTLLACHTFMYNSRQYKIFYILGYEYVFILATSCQHLVSYLVETVIWWYLVGRLGRLGAYDTCGIKHVPLWSEI